MIGIVERASLKQSVREGPSEEEAFKQNPRVRKTKMGSQAKMISLDSAKSTLNIHFINQGTPTVDQQNEGTYQEGFLVADVAQISKQSLEAIAVQGPLTQVVLLGEACLWHSTACLHCVFAI